MVAVSVELVSANGCAHIKESESVHMWIRWDDATNKWKKSSDQGQNWSDLVIANSVSSAPASHTHAASAITSGTLGIARIPSIPYSKLSLSDGDIPYAKLNVTDGAIAFSKISIADDDIPWSKVNKTGSSLGDLATRAVANLSDGSNVALKNAANTFTENQTIPQVNANGVKFPASQSASADANCLDDYEEGTWTPVIGGTTSESGQSYSVQSGRYTKIGRFVIADCDVTLSAKGTITGGVVIKGLPFTNGNYTCAGVIGYFSSLASNFIAIFITIRPNTAEGALFGTYQSAVGPTTLTSAHIGNSTRFVASMFYMV
jgi:hypothetical protein